MTPTDAQKQRAEEILRAHNNHDNYNFEFPVYGWKELSEAIALALAEAVAAEREATMRECADHGCMWCRERSKP